jgi:CubicO group peptidase (beta-lactamase class C family)
MKLEVTVDVLAERTRFSGIVRVDRSGSIELTKPNGFADRRHAILNTIDTQFAIASGTKGLRTRAGPGQGWGSTSSSGDYVIGI